MTFSKGSISKPVSLPCSCPKLNFPRGALRESPARGFSRLALLTCGAWARHSELLSEKTQDQAAQTTDSGSSWSGHRKRRSSLAGPALLSPHGSHTVTFSPCAGMAQSDLWSFPLAMRTLIPPGHHRGKPRPGSGTQSRAAWEPRRLHEPQTSQAPHCKAWEQARLR